MEAKKLRVLIVDDQELILIGLEGVLSGRCNIHTAKTSEEARSLLLSNRFDLAILDINLMNSGVSGFEIARWCRNLDPRMAVIMMTAGITGHQDSDRAVPDDIVDKSADPDVVFQIGSNAVWRRRMSLNVRRRRFEMLSPILAHQSSIKIIGRTGSIDGAERIDGVLANKEDSTPIPIAWVVYTLPGKGIKRNHICVASSAGCAINCLFCLSGRRQFVRPLTTSEIIAQVLGGMESYQTRELFEGTKPQQLVINFTTEGDSVTSNLDNSCEAIKLINSLKMERLPVEFVMTTVGHEANLNRFLEKYIQLPVTFYWSLNFTDPETRNKFMPVQHPQSITALRDVFQKITEASGRKVTASYILIPGLNDSDKSVRELKELLGGRPFEIKVMALEPGSLKDYESPSERQMNAFTRKLKKAGLAFRERKIVGGKLMAGCGKTFPLDDDSPKS
jgi:adenine C2-methylase RlmN of 23S rRNA A2503 and tRNA A37/ActR/RegA family two-component response regulator